MDLTAKQTAELWGEDGPYSEARYLIEHRILDDSVSRIFLRVEVNINPFTYKTVKKNRKEFVNDEMVQKILDNSKCLGFKDGYLAVPFEGQFLDDNNKELAEEAMEILEETKKAVIRMHEYVMKMIEKPAFVIKIK